MRLRSTLTHPDMDVTANGMPANRHNLFVNSDLREFRLLHPKERLDGTAESLKPFRKQQLCGDIHKFYGIKETRNPGIKKKLFFLPSWFP